MGLTAAKRAQAQKAARETASPPALRGAAEPSAESAARFAAAKQKETAAVEQQGFNPYAPIFGTAAQAASAVKQVAAGEVAPIMDGGSGSGNGRSGTGASSGNSSGGGGALPTRVLDRNHPPAPPDPSVVSVETADDGAIEGLDALSEGEQEALECAFALLASAPAADARDAVATVGKLLGNLVARFDDEKVGVKTDDDEERAG